MSRANGALLVVLALGGPALIAEATPGPQTLTVENVQPTMGTQGTPVTITGSGFGTAPGDLCVVLLDGNRTVTFQVINASNSEITAILGPVPPDVTPGPIMVARGNGLLDTFDPMVECVDVLEDVWVWSFSGEAEESDQTFIALPTDPPDGVQYFFSGQPNASGQLFITLDQPWPTAAEVRISGRVWDFDTFPAQGYDQLAACLRYRNTTSALDCANRICDSITGAWDQIGNITVGCFFVKQQDGTVDLFLSLPGQSIDAGNLTVCVSPDVSGGDTNGDGQVNVTDLVNVISSWGTGGQGDGFNADINDDGMVDVTDLVNGVINNWGPLPPCPRDTIDP